MKTIHTHSTVEGMDAAPLTATIAPCALALDAAPATTHCPPRRLDSTQLLQGARELEIDHGGQLYRLRLTSLGKLILTK